MKYVKTFGEFVNENNINEANKKVEKAIDNVLDAFDDANHEWRYKTYDVQEYGGDWFVNWITQEDYNNDGEEVLAEELYEVAEEFDVDIYLYYIVRDDDTGNNNVRTKKGYTKVN
jgi:hypothetical protein